MSQKGIQKTEQQTQLLQNNLYKRLKLRINEDSANTKIDEFLDSKCPTIGKTKNVLGAKVVKNEITAHMVVFIDYIGVKNSFTLNHIDILVQDIMDKYPLLRISEVIFILKMARTGQFGEMYNNVNPIKIMTWFDFYFNERTKKHGERSLNKWSAQKANEIKESARPLFTDGQRLGNISKAINGINKA